jgi:hypothetical protein
VPELFLEDGVDALLQRVRAVLEHVDRSREGGRRNRCGRCWSEIAGALGR